MNNKKGLRILAVGLLSSAVLFGCSRKKTPTSTPSSDNSTPPISETTSNGNSSSEKSDNPISSITSNPTIDTTSGTTTTTTSDTTSTTTSDTTSTTTSDATSTTTSDDTSTTTSDTTSTTTSDDTSTTTSDTTSTGTSDETSDTSSETSSSDVSSDDPVKTGVTVKIGSLDAVGMTEIDPDPADKNMVKQYSIEGVKVDAGDKLVFTVDGKVVAPGASGEGNNAKADANGLTIVSAGEKVNIYLKVYSDGYDVWVTKGSTTPVVKGYEVTVNGTKVEVGELEKGPTDAYACTVELKKDEVLAITNDGKALTIDDTAKTEFKCTIAGTHKIYVNDKGQAWIIEPAAPVETVYTVKVNSKDVAITLIPDSENHAQFKLTLTKGDKVVVYGDGKALTGGEYTGTEFTVKTTGEHKFYINVDDVVYLTEPSITPDPVVGTTYTVTNLPSWIQADGCVIFAWVWSDTNPGEWIETKCEGTTLTFTTKGEITGMLLARCVAGTKTPNWNLHDPSNQLGRIYNQTEDIAVKNGVTSYNGSSWKEYH